MAYADYSLSNTSGYETEEERRRREMSGQVGPVDPSGLGLQLPNQMQQQNMQMGQPPVLPQQPVQPEMQPSSPIPSAESMQGVDQGVAQTQQPIEQHPVTPHLEAYQTAQEDPGALLKMSQDQNVPEWMRSRAREQAANLLNNEKGFQEAKAQLPKMAPEDLASALRQKTTEGSWLKALMYGALGMDQSAQAEAAKLGIGKETAVMGADGVTPYMIKTAANGTPIEGYNAATGQKLSANELVSATAGATAIKGTQTHTGKMQDITTGEIYYERTTPQGIQLVDPQGKRYAGSTANLRAYGIGSDIGTKNLIQLQELQNKLAFAGPTASAAEREKVIAESEAKFGPLPESYKAQVRAGQPIPQGTAQQPTAVNQPQAVQGQPVQQNQLPPAAGQVVQNQPAVVSQQPVVSGQRVVGGGNTPAQREANIAIAKKQAEENINVAGARSKAFNDILDTEIRPQAQAGDTVVSVRKQQFSMFDRPGVDANKIFGLYNSAQENPGDQKLSIIRDIFGGSFKPEAEVSQRLAQLNLSPQERSMLAEYNISNQRINAATLKQTAGPGSVSDAEQKANRESNVDPTKIPALGAYNAMAQSQFNGDLARYKGDWAESHPAQNALQLDKAWRKESTTLSQMYGDIAKKRAEYISANGATTAAVKDGYKKYPVPEYDPNSGAWKKTKPLADIYGR